ncbi:MAG: 4-hydroxy-tetrahydrodipicolinate reductase [Cucumibacter sp.]
MASLRIAVAGAGGRMGQAVVRAVHSLTGAVLTGALERSGAEAIGRDAGELAGLGPIGVVITDRADLALGGADAIIDFTAPASSVALAKFAASRSLVHVIGTTGFDARQLAAIKRAAKRARIVKTGNMSMGVNLLVALVERAAAALGNAYDIEILEIHHRQKVDAPSGTALMLGEAAANGRKISLAKSSVRARDGITGARRQGTIGFASLRGGTVVGEHRVILAGPGERIEMTHIAEDRSIYANGALAAALWARDQAPGFYSMADVLGLGQA